MRRPCDKCGGLYEAQRASSKFCSARCRVAASAARDAPPAVSSAGGVTVAATRAALEAAGRESSFLGALALTLAERVDSTPGSGAATLGRELRETMADALKGAEVAADDVDDLKARRDRKLAAG